MEEAAHGERRGPKARVPESGEQVARAHTACEHVSCEGSGRSSHGPHAPSALVHQILKTMLKAPIHVYRWTLKPWTGHHCRHWPTCSQYALDAIDTNGAWRGFWLMISRLVRCGPGGTHGVDPAPDIRDEHHPFAPWRYGRWRGISAIDPP